MEKSEKLICPKCSHDKFKCDALIFATLKTVYDDDYDEIDYEFEEWDDIETIIHFNCVKCNFKFYGDEDEFREFLESKSVKN